MTATRSCFTQTAATAASSSREKTRPAGLFGELRTRRRVRGVTAASRAAGSSRKSGGARGTIRAFAWASGDPGKVGVVEGLEDDRLVAGVEERGEGRAEGLGGAGVDRDLRGGVVLEAVEAPLVLRHRLLQRGQARHGGVLVVAGAEGRDRGPLDEFRAVEVGVALAEVDRRRAGGRGPSSRRRPTCRSRRGET